LVLANRRDQEQDIELAVLEKAIQDQNKEALSNKNKLINNIIEEQENIDKLVEMRRQQLIN